MSAPTVPTPNFPRIPLRRQSAYGAAPLDFTKKETIDYTKKIMNEFTEVSEKLLELQESKMFQESQMKYYTDLLEASQDPTIEPEDPIYEDYNFRPEFYPRYTPNQRYNIQHYWQTQLEDAKFELGCCCADIYAHDRKYYQLSQELNRIQHQLNIQYISNCQSKIEEIESQQMDCQTEMDNIQAAIKQLPFTSTPGQYWNDDTIHRDEARKYQREYDNLTAAYQAVSSKMKTLSAELALMNDRLSSVVA